MKVLRKRKGICKSGDWRVKDEKISKVCRNDKNEEEKKRGERKVETGSKKIKEFLFVTRKRLLYTSVERKQTRSTLKHPAGFQPFSFHMTTLIIPLYESTIVIWFWIHSIWFFKRLWHFS